MRPVAIDRHLRERGGEPHRVGISGHRLQSQSLAIIFDDVEDAEIGNFSNRELDDLRQRLLEIERRRQLLADFREERLVSLDPLLLRNITKCDREDALALDLELRDGRLGRELLAVLA